MSNSHKQDDFFLGRITELMLLDKAISLNRPVALVGPTGNGKTYMVNHWARQNDRKVCAVSGSAGATTDQLVGFWRPESLPGGGFELKWEDGLLSRAVREGWVFVFEELSRAPQEILGRLFSLTDTDNPIYGIPERGGDDALGVDIHPDFRFVACFNDFGAGYFVSRVDAAFLDRFYVVKMGYLPTEVEKKIVEHFIGTHKQWIVPMMNVTELSRSQKDDSNSISTRDLALWAEMGQALKGDMKQAFNVAIGAKKKASVTEHMLDIFGRTATPRKSA